MPTYTYRCAEGHEFEVEQKVTDKPVKSCHIREVWFGESSACGLPVKRLIPKGTGVVLKGSGWARDGYKGERS